MVIRPAKCHTSTELYKYCDGKKETFCDMVFLDFYMYMKYWLNLHQTQSICDHFHPYCPDIFAIKSPLPNGERQHNVTILWSFFISFLLAYYACLNIPVYMFAISLYSKIPWFRSHEITSRLHQLSWYAVSMEGKCSTVSRLVMVRYYILPQILCPVAYIRLNIELSFSPDRT